MSTEALPDNLYHLAGDEAESLWRWWLYEWEPEPDPAAYGLVVDFTPDPALFDE